MEIKGTEDFIQVVRAGDYDWEWSEIVVWYSPSRRKYFWFSDSGCSCTYFGEYLTSFEEYKFGDRNAARREIMGYESSQEALTTFNKFKP